MAEKVKPVLNREAAAVKRRLTGPRDGRRTSGNRKRSGKRRAR